MSEAIYWDGLRLRPVSDVPEQGEAVYFVHMGNVIRARITRLIWEGTEFKGVLLGGTWKLKPREYGTTAWELRLKRIALSNPPSVVS